MYTRPAYKFVSATSGSWAEIITHKKGASKTAVQLVPLFQESTCDCKIKSYFLMNCKPQLFVAGDNSPSMLNFDERDVRAEWLGLAPTFEGTFSVEPWQRQIGAVLNYNQDLGSWIDTTFLKYWWLDVSLPVFQVYNNLNPLGPKDLLNALKRPELENAKMEGGRKKKTGVGELRVALGTTVLNTDCFTLTYYGAIAFPGETRRCTTYIFRPSTGTNGHMGLVNGLLCRLPFYRCCDRGDSVDFFCSIELDYRFRREEWRVFDLCHKQWSRYLLVRREGDPRTIPAANILTKYVEVCPHNAVDLSAGISIDHEGLGAEVGYNLWATQTEQIKHLNPPRCNKEIHHMEEYGIAGTAPGSSASTSTISKQGPDDTAFVHLHESQLDFCSAAAQGSGSQRVFASLFYQGGGECNNALVKIGGFIDWPHNNSTLKTYGVWGNIAFGW
ncbi:MAG: hypothetical protein UW09_C0002G0049 [candidate division TM6 bacterium GW2011_GWF2_43_87]|nr:MAG: hypothetical protein UW09_C0002G0049 [candidate division TM6 bacterium GW2011_GWF2_43_87]